LLNGDYKLLYIIINANKKFHKAQIFNYPKSVVDWMELETEEIYFDFLKEIYNSAKTEIEIDLISRYDIKESEGNRGKDNIYRYIYLDFQLTPINITKILLSENEIELLNTYLTKVKEFNIYMI